ncbi:MAG: ribonuclease III [Planctomycetes bacterium]|nr:ribonuclease III [Planctomycetota bacterium]
MDADRLQTCQSILKYEFLDATLLQKALTHSSIKTAENPSNERLEFLGDAILGMVISEHLYRAFPEFSEGQLTKVKSVVVSSRALGKTSRALRLEDSISVGKGIAVRRAIPRSLLANVFEAIVAAIYLDRGVDAARTFILDHLGGEIEMVLKNQHQKNYKSLLQHFVQKEFGEIPTYRVLEEQGPDHSKTFKVGALVKDREYGVAWGRNKKEAEQRAAKEALRALRGENGQLAEIDDHLPDL